MSWIDLVVLAIVVGFAVIGMTKGLIYTIFKLVSFFVSILIAVKCYPLLANVLMKTPLHDNIKFSIMKNLLLQQQAQTPGINSQAKNAAADAVVNNLHLPGFLKNSIIDQLPNPSKLIPVAQIMNQISEALTKVVVDVISLVLLYIAIRIALIFVRALLQGVAQLPVFKQMNKLGGFAFGAVEGLLTIYLVFAVIMLLHTVPQLQGVYTAIDNSLIAKFFYQNNFIVSWMSMKVV